MHEIMHIISGDMLWGRLWIYHAKYYWFKVEVDNGTPQSSEHKPEKVAPEEVTSKIVSS